ncbi:hypothetical protein AGABI1DRAFT_116532, partial [Agaricus bisporus var. burnettii JB137-S8]
SYTLWKSCRPTQNHAHYIPPPGPCLSKSKESSSPSKSTTTTKTDTPSCAIVVVDTYPSKAHKRPRILYHIEKVGDAIRIEGSLKWRGRYRRKPRWLCGRFSWCDDSFFFFSSSECCL